MYPGIKTLDQIPITSTMEKLPKVLTPLMTPISRQCYISFLIPENRVIEGAIVNEQMSNGMAIAIIAYIIFKTCKRITMKPKNTQNIIKDMSMILNQYVINWVNEQGGWKEILKNVKEN